MADRYVDSSKSTGTLTGTWTFTNASTSVTAAADGDAVNELANGDYIRQSDGIQWYKVTDRPNADTITITPAFQQATHTDDVGASLYNSETGAGTATAFAHHNQATTDEARTAGDIIRVRGGLTYTYAGQIINHDEDGTVNSYIEERGIYTAAGDNSWSDGDTTRPVIDFGDTTAYLGFGADRYWKLSGHEIIQSANTTGGIQAGSASYGMIIEDCIIRDHSTYGVIASGDGTVIFLDCTFYENGTASIRCFGTIHVLVDGCTFNGGGGANNSNYGIINAVLLTIRDSIFGVTTDHDNADIDLAGSGKVIMRNVKLDSATQIAITAAGHEYAIVRSEDDGQVHLAFKAWSFTGTIEKDTGETPPGGSGWAMRGDENSNCGSEQPLFILGDWLRGVPVYLDGTAQTITVKIRCLGADWTDGRPDNTELFMELDYNDGAASWTTVQSTEACVDDTYTSFTVTITPNAAGPAYIRVKLLVYHATGGGKPVYVDPIPTFS